MAGSAPSLSSPWDALLCERRWLSILLIEDDKSDARLLEVALGEAVGTSYLLTRVARCAEGERLLRETRFHAVLLDLHLPDSDGLETFDRIRAAAPEIPIVILTGSRDEVTAGEAMRRGAQDYLVKEQLPGPSVDRALRHAVERQQAQAALRASEQRFWRVFHDAAVGISLIDAAGRLEAVNDALARMLGFAAEELVGRHFRELTADVDAEAHQRLFAELLVSGRQCASLEKRFVHRRGVHVWGLLTDSVVRDESGRFLHCIEIVQDVTEWRNAHRGMAELVHREQRRIGRDLHDGLGQDLTALNLLATGLQWKLEEQSSPLAESAAEIVSLLYDAQTQWRRVLRGLQPVDVDGAGLMAALAELTESMARIGGIACRFECPDAVHVADNDTATQLFQIVQEALRNAVKHAGARRIEVSLRETADQLVLQVRDDGVGVGDGRDPRGGMGLRIMRYRAEIIGGQLTVAASRPRGTLVTCSLARSRGHGTRESGTAG